MTAPNDIAKSDDDVRTKPEHESAEEVATGSWQSLRNGKVQCSAEVGRREGKLLMRGDGQRTEA